MIWGMRFCLKRRSDVPTDIEIREFTCRQAERDAWVSAHKLWWPARKDAAVWGKFSNQAASGRFTFSSVNQPSRHFGETLVAWHLERDGYVCWTGARILRKPDRALGKRAAQTEWVDCLLRQTTGVIPQVEYKKRYFSPEALRLKSIDVVGFHFGRRQWVFSEVKRRDRVHSEQSAALRFLRDLFPKTVATVFVAWVRER
jgi:hypothetical protein